MNQFLPDWTSPPGHSIQDLLEELELTNQDAAILLGLEKLELEALLIGELRIDEALAERISIHLGSTKGFWLRREENYRSDLVRLGLKNSCGGVPDSKPGGSLDCD